MIKDGSLSQNAPRGWIRITKYTYFDYTYKVIVILDIRANFFSNQNPSKIFTYTTYLSSTYLHMYIAHLNMSLNVVDVHMCYTISSGMQLTCVKYSCAK